MNQPLAGPTAPPGAEFCGLCGVHLPRDPHAGAAGPSEPHGTDTDDGGSAPPSSAHLQCRERMQLEPPRHCADCGRRLKVQVTPLGWLATCSRHGPSSSVAQWLSEKAT